MSLSIPADYPFYIYKNSMDAMLLTTPDGKIFCANPAACEMFQMSEEEICRAGRSGLVDQNNAKLPDALKHREAYGKARAVLRFIRKDGSRFYAECSSAVFHDDQGTLWASLIIHEYVL